MPSKRATITPVSKVENTFIPITFGAKICIYSEKPRLCVFYDVASDSPGSIFLVLFWGDCQKRTPKPKSRADGISPVHLTYFAIFPRPHSYNSYCLPQSHGQPNGYLMFQRLFSPLPSSGHPHCWACVLLMGGYVP